MKRGQITVFIILAILIVALIGVLFFYRINLSNVSGVNNEISPVYLFALNCIEKSGEEAIYNIGQTGGYIEVPNLSTDNNLAYYLYEEQDLMPSIEKIQEELSSYMNDKVFFCTKNFIDFPDYHIKQGEIKTKTTIANNSVMFEVNYPLSIEKENKTYLFNYFKNIEIPVRLGVIYYVNQLILKDLKKNRPDVCASCLNTFADENNLYIDLYGYKGSLVFMVSDPQSRINEEQFTFYFANKL
ncbi:MAG: hypothetical protein WC979_04315 [Candidatus Pacearchaeota archaeon]|jgi:hypothetical protein